MTALGSNKVQGDPDLERTAIVGEQHIYVAPNGKVGKVTVPAYGQATEQGFPGGFEVRIDGPSTGKLVLVRLVLRGVRGGAHDNFAELIRVISCRDG